MVQPKYHRGQQQGPTLLAKLYVVGLIGILLLAIVLIYRQHKTSLGPNPSAVAVPTLPTLAAAQSKELTYILGQPLPPLVYQQIFQTPQTAPSGPPEADYATTDPQSQVLADITGLCKQFSFLAKKPQAAADIVSQAKSVPVEMVQCYDAHYSWIFDVEDASALTYAEYTGPATPDSANTIVGHVPASILQGQAAGKLWVSVRSLGPPTTNCRQAGKVCYAPTTSSMVKQ